MEKNIGSINILDLKYGNIFTVHNIKRVKSKPYVYNNTDASFNVERNPGPNKSGNDEPELKMAEDY